MDVVGMRIKLYKLYDKRDKKCRGEYVIESVTARDVLMRKVRIGYRECVSVVDLRQGRYKMKTMDGQYIVWPEMENYAKMFNVSAEPKKEKSKPLDLDVLFGLCKKHGTDAKAKRKIAGILDCKPSSVSAFMWRNGIKEKVKEGHK
jgi:hypothetical protein